MHSHLNLGAVARVSDLLEWLSQLWIKLNKKDPVNRQLWQNKKNSLQSYEGIHHCNPQRNHSNRVHQNSTWNVDAGTDFI